MNIVTRWLLAFLFRFYDVLFEKCATINPPLKLTKWLWLKFKFSPESITN